MNHKNGYTLIELLVALTILCILSIIVLVGIKEYLPSYRLQAASRLLWSDMMNARSLSVRTGYQYRIVFDKRKMLDGSGLYELQKGSSGSSSVYEKDFQDQTFKVRNLKEYPGISIQKFTNNPIFNPSGMISSLCTVTLTNGKEVVNISTSLAGRIKIK